ncbi:hypothetical protein C804_05853 [Lachnospiraceae bacterium A4]|nr:hypothetical protein C804_05853 [Lachnospiraceae bacterium A4]
MTRGTNNAGPAGDKGTSGQNVPKSPKGLKNKKSKFRMESEQEKISKSKLRMETREDKLNRARKKLEGKKPPKPRGPVRRVLGAAGWSAHGFVHGKVYEVEHENVGTEGAHRSELVGEAVGRAAVHTVKKRIREHPARAVHKAETQYIKARADYQFRMAAQENPELAKNAVTRYWHKQKLKKQYAKQARQAAKQTAKQGAKAAGKTAAATEKLAERAVAFVKRHPVGALIALACVVLVLSLQSCASSLITLGNAAAGAVGATTYPAQDGDMLGAETAYCSLEAELQHYLDTYESTHDYDEYHFDLDAIEHDPYVLVSILSAWHEGEWTLADVQPTLQMLFDRQYTLTENVVKERRYYIETDTWTDEEGNTHTDSYRVYYDYYICYVTLDNFNLSHLPIYIMGEDKVSRYSLYMATLGNRPDLFPGSSYVGKYTSPPEGYEVPGEYLDDETFAAMLSEAEKYLGYPYVWGGSSPATSFDCSGFVSWVVNHSGWNVGRLGAQGLYNICTRTSSPRPGDLVFFKGTYDTPGVSHCGIYVGDGMMIHCGDVRPDRAKVEVDERGID